MIAAKRSLKDASPAVEKIGKVSPDVVEEYGYEDLKIHAVAECGVRLKGAVEVAPEDGVPMA